MPTRFTVLELTERIKKIHPNLELISEEGGGKHRKVIVRDEYGDHLINLGSLLSGRKTSIKSAIDKLSYVDNRFRDLQPDLYNQVKIIQIMNEGDGNKKVLISTEFGKCKVSISSLLISGAKPTILVAIDKNDYYTNQARKIHGDKYSYEKVNYVDCLTKIKIWCKVHKEYFLQVPYYHLYGAGCEKCGKITYTENAKNNPSGWSYKDWDSAAKRSSTFESFKVYIIKCRNDKETFFKVGKTYTAIGKRFRDKKLMPYNWKLIKEIIGDARTICELETSIKAKNKQHQYFPEISFKGKGECFKKIIINDISV